jgi:hypothetical protein
MLRTLICIAVLLTLASCVTTDYSCHEWPQGTYSVNDTRLTREWMITYETLRQGQQGQRQSLPLSALGMAYLHHRPLNRYSNVPSGILR